MPGAVKCCKIVPHCHIFSSVSIQGIVRPDPFYVDQAINTLEHLIEMGIPAVCNSWLTLPPCPDIVSIDSLYSAASRWLEWKQIPEKSKNLTCWNFQPKEVGCCNASCGKQGQASWDRSQENKKLRVSWNIMISLSSLFIVVKVVMMMIIVIIFIIILFLLQICFNRLSSRVSGRGQCQPASQRS